MPYFAFAVLFLSLVGVILVTSPASCTRTDTCYSLRGLSDHVWRCSPVYVPRENITGAILLDWANAYCRQLKTMIACFDAELDYCVAEYRDTLKEVLGEKGAFCNHQRPLDWLVRYAEANKDQELLSLDCLESMFFTTVETLCRGEAAKAMLTMTEEYPVLEGIAEARIASRSLLTCMKGHFRSLLSSPECQGHTPVNVYFTMSVAGNVMFDQPFSLRMDENDFILTQLLFLQ